MTHFFVAEIGTYDSLIFMSHVDDFSSINDLVFSQRSPSSHLTYIEDSLVRLRVDENVLTRRLEDIRQNIRYYEAFQKKVGKKVQSEPTRDLSNEAREAFAEDDDEPSKSHLTQTRKQSVRDALTSGLTHIDDIVAYCVQAGALENEDDHKIIVNAVIAGMCDEVERLGRGIWRLRVAA